MDFDETYILLLLSDSNLPTGSFVASSGLESYATHGFLSPQDQNASKDKLLLDFIRDSISAYGHSALPFVSDAYRVTTQVAGDTTHSQNDFVIRNLTALDELYDTMTLNHVARRASRSQGVALLTLFTKGFSKPREASKQSPPESTPSLEEQKHAAFTKLIEKFKTSVRREDTHGHLPVCWGVLTAALGLSLERSQFLHLFLHARGLLSAAVRMNTLGPYAAQQLLLHSIRPLVTTEASKCADLRTGLRLVEDEPDQGLDPFDEDVLDTNGPAMTWPLGEILASRHDLQHSRVFNS
ncbi:hypothetical protein NLI96_g7710 [Meripilus lineatus]|uniref:Urease accessory protein UreF n=1 Tax=Meripilus lineatus TaxID=2056292 RepID=A0AAD5UYV5_9APHY|nr:hypothetical protein NLI96_g7710 [Physisporinus lineatus]